MNVKISHKILIEKLAIWISLNLLSSIMWYQQITKIIPPPPPPPWRRNEGRTRLFGERVPPAARRGDLWLLFDYYCENPRLGTMKHSRQVTCLPKTRYEYRLVQYCHCRQCTNDIHTGCETSWEAHSTGPVEWTRLFEIRVEDRTRRMSWFIPLDL